MRHRAVFFDGLMIPLWAFVCFLYLSLVGLDISLVGLGVIFGLVLGSAVALKYIGSIEKNGEYRVTLKTWAFLLLTIIIVLPIALYLLFSLGPEVGIQMINFIYPSIPALYAARMILYLNWERKHARRIVFDGLLVVTRVYAAPELRGDSP